MKTSFQIIAAVSFAIPSFLKGAFNAHHKTRLVKDAKAGTGKVTAEGAKFFSNRPRLNDAELTAALTAAGYILAPVDGVQWPINKTGQKWQAGSGLVGQTAFALALSTLTQGAAAAATKAAAKPAAKAKAAPKPKASAKPRALAMVKA